MKISKKMISALCLSLVFSLLAACSGKSNSSESTASVSNEPSPSASASASPSASPSESASAAPELSGTFKISIPNGSASVWGAVADAYMQKHPNVKVTVDNKPLEGYKEWLTSQFAAGTPEVDLAVINEVDGLQRDQKFVDYLPWLEQTNPYTGKAWKESLDLGTMGVNLDAMGANDHLWVLNFESVQIVWLYNKEIFAKAGITEAPTTFNQLIDDFKKIKEAGYIPLALGGNSNSMWSGEAGWLVRVYGDQYMRDSIEIVRSQPDDYNFVAGLDDQWKFDPADPYNDSNSRVTKNDVRVWKAIKEKTGPFKIEGNPKWKAFMENLKTLFSYTEPGFFGVNAEQAYSLFLTGKAATMMSTPGSYWQLPKDLADEKKSGVKGGAKPFEFGFFNMPSMEGPEVMAPARTIQIPIGFYGLVSKDAKQTELGIDFMMYLTSPEGYKVYVTAIQNSKDASLAGAPAVKDIELPEEMAKAFANFKPIGNTEGFPSANNSLARGAWDYQPSVQEWVGLIQQYFGNKITTDEFLTKYQAVIDKHLPGALKEKKLEMSDLDTPERKPPERK